jgi:predicted dehydrogenase
LWGRDPGRAAEAAGELQLPAYPDFDALLDDVDAVAFSVAPTAQPGLAVRAARAGKHLLLDKPVALEVHAAEAVLEAATAADVAALVFFTDRFMPSGRAWFEEVAATSGWSGGLGHWIGALDGSPFAGSAWRRRNGAFWDLGPHMLSTFTATLGPVHELTAIAGPGDVVHFVARHHDGVTSCATLTQFAPTAVESVEFMVWGAAGISRKPPRDDRPDLAFAAAADELAALAERDGAARRDHPSGLGFGVHVVSLLAAAEAAMQRAEEPEGPLGIA